MKIEMWRQTAQQQLEKSGDMDAAWDADWMLCEVLGCGRGELRWRAKDELTQPQKVRLDTWLYERIQGRPLQYVLGNTCFMGLDFKCDERALIPRQDTETLVEIALEKMQSRKFPRVLDLCCGTGAIGLSVKHFRPDSDVTLTDISDEALSLTQENAKRLSLAVNVRQGDLFEAVRGEKYDFVLSNPPYLTKRDMDELMREVRYEPQLALRGGEDGLNFYRRIAEEMDEMLNESGEALLEIGIGQHTDVIALLSAHGFEAVSYMDICGIERVIHAKRK